MNADWFVVVFWVLAGVERWYERRYSEQAQRGDTKAAWSYLLLHGFYIGVFVVSLVEYFGLRRQLCWPVTVVGLAIFLAALVIRLAAIRTLGRFWSLHVEIRQEHRLVREGIYKHMRHPAYSAMALEIVAIPLVANAYLTTVLGVVTFIPMLLLRWRREERELIGKLGEPYVRYRNEVCAFFPVPQAWRGRPKSR